MDWRPDDEEQEWFNLEAYIDGFLSENPTFRSDVGDMGRVARWRIEPTESPMDRWRVVTLASGEEAVYYGDGTCVSLEEWRKNRGLTEIEDIPNTFP